MLVSIIKLLFFVSVLSLFGFLVLNLIARIKSLVLLIPFSIILGIASYIFFLHLLAFCIGPQNSSIFTLVIFLVLSILILIFKHSNLIISLEISKKQLIYLSITTLIISTLTFLASSRFCIHDKEWHVPLTLTLFHNNTYPPREFYNPSYYLLYHYGGDLLVGAIHFICNLDINLAFTTISTLSSNLIFLSFFSLGWLLTNKFKLSLVIAFCTYFGYGFIWLDTIIRYFNHNLPPFASNWNFIKTFFYLGMHGGITDAPSIAPFTVAASMGIPILIFLLIIFSKTINENPGKKSITLYISLLTISLTSLLLVAEWLFITFLGAISIYLGVLILKKQKKLILLTAILILISLALYKLIGNPLLYTQEQTQLLGRNSFYDFRIKINPLTFNSWRRLNIGFDAYQQISIFSMGFISELGLTLILIPIAIIYLIKNKNILGLLLFSSAISTIPLPFLFESIDFNRFLGFSNSMFILLITTGIGTMYSQYKLTKIIFPLYIFVLCLSPSLGLSSAAIFTPNIYSLPDFIDKTFEKLREGGLKKFNEYAISYRDNPYYNHKKLLNYLKSNCKSRDVAISTLPNLSLYAGVYTIIPPGVAYQKDFFYSKIDNTFQILLETLDPFLLSELNIRWVLISNSFKNNISKDTLTLLTNKKIMNLAYKHNYLNNNNENQTLEIYHVNQIKKLLKEFNRKTAWILINTLKEPIEIKFLNQPKITLFPYRKDALFYLNKIQKMTPNLKKEFIIAQPIVIKSFEEEINNYKLTIRLDKRF